MIELIREAPRPPDRRLGRNLNHDPLSRAFAIRSRAATAVTTRHERVIPVLDQGNVGSCTGNALTGVLGTVGMVASVMASLGQASADPAAILNESFALNRYSRATVVDPYPGTYPGEDTGSDGVSVCKAAQQDGLIGGYVHALSLDAMVTGLQTTSGIIGINWYSSFDNPIDGVLSLLPNARLEGGHELHVLNVNMERQWFEVVNSWTAGWGANGKCYISFPLMDRLLKEDGDATFPLSVSNPPTPSPTVSRKFAAEDAQYLDTWSGKRTLLGFTAAKAKAAWKRGS